MKQFGTAPRAIAEDSSTHGTGPNVNKKKKFSNVSWGSITIEFLNGDDVIIVIADQRETMRGISPAKKHANYKDMGFENKKTSGPNKQWKFLKWLSEHGGELSWRTNGDIPVSEVGLYKKRKQLLSEGLQRYFVAADDDDPFYDHKREKAYKIKMHLIPEGGVRVVKEIDRYDENDRLGVEEVLRDLQRDDQ